MTHRVRIVEEAEYDLLEIFEFIATNDSLVNAENVLDQLENLCLSLESEPLRGHTPPELDAIGVKAYREVHFKPYRVIYEVIGREVYIHCIVDGRRDMQKLLERRLLR